MIESALLFGPVLILLFGAFAVQHAGRHGRVSLIDWSILAVGAFHGVGWIIVAVATDVGANPYWEDWLLSANGNYPLQSLGALVLGGAMLVGWHDPLSLLRRALLRPLLVQSSTLRPRRWLWTAWVLVLAGIGTHALYTRAYGGFLGLFDYSRLIRAGLMPVSNSMSFLQPFGGLGLVGSLVFFGLWLSGHRQLSIKLGGSLALVFTLYLLLVRAGRVRLVVYVLSLVIAVLVHRKHNVKTMLTAVGAGMMVLLLGAYLASNLLNLKPADSLLGFIAKELSYPFVSFQAQLESGRHLFRALYDVATGPLYLLPSSWWMNWVDDVSTVNTILVLGAAKGEGGVSGGIPVDLLTLGLMQGHFLGIAVVGAGFGFLLRFLQTTIDRVAEPGVRATLESYLAMKVAVLGVFYSQPAHIVAGNFDLIASGVLILSLNYLSRLRGLRVSATARA